MSTCILTPHFFSFTKVTCLRENKTLLLYYYYYYYLPDEKQWRITEEKLNKNEQDPMLFRAPKVVSTTSAFMVMFSYIIIKTSHFENSYLTIIAHMFRIIFDLQRSLICIKDLLLHINP